MRRSIVLLCCSLLVGFAQAAAPWAGQPVAGAPYSGGALAAAGSALYFPSGSIPGSDAPADVKGQALQVLSRLQDNLRGAGVSFDDVGFVRAYLAPGADGGIDYAGWEAAWQQVFGERAKPARTTVGVPFLGSPRTLVEVEFVALPAALPAPAQGAAAELPSANPRLRVLGTREARIASGIGIAAGTAHYFTAGTLAPVLDANAPTTARAHKGDMRTQAQGTLRRLQENLATVGLTFADVTYLRAFLAPDVHLGGRFDYDGWNAAYAEFFNSDGNPHKPARTTVTTPGFGDPATLIEIEVVAAFPRATDVFAAGGNAPLRAWMTPASPIASAVAVRDDSALYFSAGAVGAGDTVEAQATAALETLRARMADQGLTPADVAFLRAYVVPEAGGAIDRAGWSAAYSKVFGTATQPHKPARTTIAVQSLPRPGLKVMIDVVAARRR